MKQLFADDPGRGDRFTLDAAGIFLDYSKNRITDETLTLLIQLAEESGAPGTRIDAMFGGQKDQHYGESCGIACRYSRAEG